MSQGILLDFPITYQIPTPGSRSFSTSRGDLINKLEEIGDRWVENLFKECRQSAGNAESFTWPVFFRVGLDGNACALRLLCEVVDRPLKKAGLLGDIINLVLRYTWQSVLYVVHDLPTFLQR